MFILVQIKDTIRIAPEDAHLLQTDPLHLIRVEINNKYANKVIPDVGLCTLVHSILSYDDPQLFPSDPGPYVRCTFRLVVLQPQEGEIISGKISAADANGFYVSIDFFKHILVEPAHLPTGSRWDAEEKVWIWENDGNSYYFDHGMALRVKVVRCAFPSQLISSQQNSSTNQSTSTLSTPSLTPAPSSDGNDNKGFTAKALKHGYARPQPVLSPQHLNPRLTPLQQQQQQQQAQEESTKSAVQPYIIYGSVADIGLGPIEWWD